MHVGKVEISGVNTSKLGVLTEEQKSELLTRIKAGDKKAGDEFIYGNLRLVLSVIQRFGGRGESVDDLFQVGCIGLIKAMNNFDTTLGVRFSTYAVPMIIGEIRRYMRDNNPIRVSRSLRDLAYKALTERERVTSETQQEPTIEELAALLEVRREDLVMALDSIMDPVSLNEPVNSENGDKLYVMDQVKDNNSNDDNWLDEIQFREAIGGLSGREKRILSLRFFSGKTQMEVADEIGISQAQVSRLEKNALSTIKKQI